MLPVFLDKNQEIRKNYKKRLEENIIGKDFQNEKYCLALLLNI